MTAQWSEDRRSRLAEILTQRGIITRDQLEIALTEQKKSRESLGKILVRLGFATEAVIQDVIGGAIGQQRVDLKTVVADREALTMLPEALARRLRVVPVDYDSGRGLLTVAMADTFNILVLDQLNAHLEGAAEVAPVLAGESEIEKSIDRFYGFELSVDGILNEIETGEIDHQSLAAQSDEYSQPMVRLVNALLSDAVKRGASDIHFEPEAGFLRFRYRIDGVLRQVRSLHKNYWSALVVRLKVMAGLDIAESRLPQDGRISLSLSGRAVDFRVSTFPTVHGENIVLRVLDRQKGIVPLARLDLGAAELTALEWLASRPQGLALVTGPTGSGKTTTLYSILNHLNTEAVNIMTLEDPVEYPTCLIRQTAAGDSSRLDFAGGIRAMLRQDPDIILVGEIRDEATAGMALRAAMTGHQVFSTLHANSAVAAIPRLFDIGIRPDLLAGNITGIVAQRLVRRLCEACKRPSRATNGGAPPSAAAEVFSHCPGGCQACDWQGYSGRVALMEILLFDPVLDELVARRASAQELLEAALAKGFRPLGEAGLAQVASGVTSYAELARVLGVSDQDPMGGNL